MVDTLKSRADAASYNLLEIKDTVHEILGEALRRRNNIGGAVNWADLNCREVRRAINEIGEIFYTAYVNEASPTAYELQKFVRDGLEKRGFHRIEVETEW